MVITEVRIKLMEENEVNERRQGEELLAEVLAQVQPSLKGKLRVRGHRCHDIEDIIQDAFLKVLEASRKDEISSPQAYFRQVVLNVGHTCLRKAMRRRERLGKEVSLDPAQLVFDAFAERDKEALREALCEAVQAAVLQLPTELKMVFTRYLEGYTASETAADLDIRVHTVRYRLRKARARVALLVEPILEQV